MVVLWLLACHKPTPNPKESSPPADSPADSPTDSSPDSDSARDTETRPPRVAGMVMDGGNEQILFIDLQNGNLLYRYDLRARFPDRCREGIACVGFGAEHDRDPITGEDRLLTITSPEGDTDDGTMVERVRLTEGGVVRDWAMTDLDFVTHYAGDTSLCSSPDPCVAPRGERGCLLDHVHELSITEDNAAEVVMWVADTASPGRLLKVRLDKTTTCGVVEDVIGTWENTPSPWDAPNDIEVVREDGVEKLLVSYFSQDGIPGRSRIVLWAPGGNGWEIQWMFPPEQDTFLAGVHNPSQITLPDGRQYLLYAHGNGMGNTEIAASSDPELDQRGSLGVAAWGAIPDYQQELTLPNHELGFVRDVAHITENFWLVTDSGCINHRMEGCTQTPALRVLQFDPDAVRSEKSGAFSADHAQQEAAIVANQSVYLPEITCSMLTPYEADVIDLSRAGSFLQSRVETPEGVCQ